VRSPEEITTDWLSDVLGGSSVESFTVEQIGTGQMSDSYRVNLAYRAGTTLDPSTPASVVVKLVAADETSRATGAALGLYEREVRFYAEIAPRIGDPVSPSYRASFEPGDGTFCLVLGDAGPARQGDEITGASRRDAELAVTALADLHAPLLGEDGLADTPWLERESPITQPLIKQLFDGFVARYEERIAPQHRFVCERLVESFDGWMAVAAEGPRGLVHGDYRLDNLLFGEAGAPRPVTVVDWQTVAWGSAATDLAYFLGCALTIEDRREWGEELTRRYHEGLGEAAPPLEDVLEGVRRQSFFGIVMAIVSPMLVVRTDRGDDMFVALLARHAQQVLDLDALALLPATAAREPLRPELADEHAHPPGEERLWNESWYFDVADGAREVGAYVRLGLYPNMGRAWYTAVICGPGRPSVAVVDYRAPLPADGALAVRTESLDAGQEPETELERYRVHLTATGEAHDDPAALLRGEPGEPVPVELDLVWETEGSPYQYRMTTRYEIPCRVRGTMTIGEETIAIDAPGQRDHSWGVRDWWGMDWMWSALHLDDGTRTHAVDLRIPGAPPIGAGYTQTPAGEVTELEVVRARETFTSDGLPSGAELALSPGGVAVQIEPVGFGPLRLTDDDGRVAEFPRAWCRVRTTDGRNGIGWMEWNRNQATRSARA
jgi:hypothetical protein